MNIPNLLTLLRIALIPVFVPLFYLPVKWAYTACALVFAIAAFTDLVDGWLARRLGQVSSLGAFLDPVADKLMVATALVLLVQRDPKPWMAIPALVIIGREITISALREWMAELGERTQVAVSMVGKFKTTAQMLAIFLLIYQAPVGNFPTYTVGYVLLYVATLLTLWSMVVYLQAAWPALTRGK
ncbi:MAG: CDP-diacylglycerol--glycerol-3-phosphate 3-phosphatidyltransferase [Gammaproteobacteria bacterium RIFOXYA12_FULL_61_12]|nr:MAG: CDP-diacylglycerol--glycerol-3-phosphate 3-phosphatidyltransferase [Gammaproteobacteria bacterium RIFOXYD12_FULL_61_37]OGT92084.1 MAG: CDP-diacylglycerol--glycerol-3-phosphate 3-phosphatidyltransferase [Gammaproteobacteria bacterium RIFOXYA12_FULL_61_12]